MITLEIFSFVEKTHLVGGTDKACDTEDTKQIFTQIHLYTYISCCTANAMLHFRLLRIFNRSASVVVFVIIFVFASVIIIVNVINANICMLSLFCL